MSEQITATVHNTFDEFFRALEGGELNMDLTKALPDLVAELEQHRIEGGKKKAKGKITITIDIVDEEGIFDVTAKFKVTKPEEVRRRSVFWATPQNKLTPSNPNQYRLGLHDATRPPAETRSV